MRPSPACARRPKQKTKKARTGDDEWVTGETHTGGIDIHPEPAGLSLGSPEGIARDDSRNGLRSTRSAWACER